MWQLAERLIGTLYNGSGHPRWLHRLYIWTCTRSYGEWERERWATHSESSW